MSAIIQLTFDGSLVRNQHQVALRDLAQAMMAIQSAADRACLDVLHGDVWKHQRLPRQHYDYVEFIVGQPQAGSYVIDFISDQAGAIVARMKKAILTPYAVAIDEAGDAVYTLGHQIEARRDMAKSAGKLVSYEDLDTADMPLIKRTYGDRSINKEFGQMLTPVSREPGGLMKLVMKDSEDDSAQTFEFNSEVAKRFKKVISLRQLGAPVVYRGTMRELDRGPTEKVRDFRGKFINASNQKTVIIHIAHKDDFSRLVPLLNSDEPIEIVAAPVIEFSSYDPVGGDIQFLEIYHG